MPKHEDILHSVLIASSSQQFDSAVRQSLKGFVLVESVKSAAMARRSILERYYDLVIINAPLRDETGEQFAIDTTQSCSASVLLVVPADVYGQVQEHVTDHGILVLSKPVPRGMVDKAIRYLTAVQSRLHRMEKKVLTLEEKMDEIRIVSKAKFYLVEKQHMTEDEAHRYIGRQAMDHGVSRKRIAEKIIEED